MDVNRQRISICRLCEREACDITEHHLIPRSTHKIKKFKRMHTKEAMHMTVSLCQPCHRSLHQFFTEKELGSMYFTIDLLLADEKIVKYVEWIKKQKPELRLKKSHKGRAK